MLCEGARQDCIGLRLSGFMAMATFAGVSMSVGASGRSIVREDWGDRVVLSVFNQRLRGGGKHAISSSSMNGCGLSASRRTAMDACSRSSGNKSASAHLYARDRVIDFGKNKGSMLGTLSSRYLRWMTKNLRGTIYSEWADYAQEVLDDPLYLDRIEWEKVEKLLVHSHDLAKLSNNKDALAPARIYGWDLDNEAAWSKVDFALLGTTKGGKIPRVPIEKEPKPKVVTKSPGLPRKKSATSRLSKVNNKWASTPVVEGTPVGGSGGSLRDELDRRRQARRERLSAQREALLSNSSNMKEQDTKFPGRGGILSKLQEKKPQQ